MGDNTVEGEMEGIAEVTDATTDGAVDRIDSTSFTWVGAIFSGIIRSLEKLLGRGFKMEIPSVPNTLLADFRCPGVFTGKVLSFDEEPGESTIDWPSRERETFGLLHQAPIQSLAKTRLLSRNGVRG